jgi:hypothetical protein
LCDRQWGGRLRFVVLVRLCLRPVNHTRCRTTDIFGFAGRKQIQKQIATHNKLNRQNRLKLVPYKCITNEHQGAHNLLIKL